MAAAVADFRPAAYATGKIKKKDGAGARAARPGPQPGHPRRDLRRRARAGQVVVGFAAETDDVLANGRAKLARKGCDLLVVNEVGERKTFGSEENEAVVLAADGSETPVPHGPKEALADTVWDLVAAPARELEWHWPSPRRGGRRTRPARRRRTRRSRSPVTCGPVVPPLTQATGSHGARHHGRCRWTTG